MEPRVFIYEPPNLPKVTVQHETENGVYDNDAIKKALLWAYEFVVQSDAELAVYAPTVADAVRLS